MRILVCFVLATTAIGVPRLVLAQQAEPTKSLPPPSPPDAPAPSATSTAPPPPHVTQAAESEPPAELATSKPQVILATPAPSAVHRDEDRRHAGFYLRAFLGGLGYASFSGDGPLGSASISGLSSSGGVAIGGAVAPGFAIAGTFLANTVTGTFKGSRFAAATGSFPAGPQALPLSFHPSTNASAALGEIGLLVDWHPRPTEGWHAGATIGLGFVGITNEADASTGGGLTLAGSAFGGYDWWLGPTWSLGVMLVANASSQASLTDSNNNDTGYRLTPVSVCVTTSLLLY